MTKRSSRWWAFAVIRALILIAFFCAKAFGQEKKEIQFKNADGTNSLLSVSMGEIGGKVVLKDPLVFQVGIRMKDVSVISLGHCLLSFKELLDVLSMTLTRIDDPAHVPNLINMVPAVGGDVRWNEQSLSVNYFKSQIDYAQERVELLKKQASDVERIREMRECVGQFLK